ncbi:MAG: PhzF family phenazine biosynthesis protein [Gemmatimonadetes bacterium]|nr:PhzF family phenazine biosynthesis protein [Gemmatimonadota bacterium]
MNPIPIFHVDAFTERPFAGNPAAVCLLFEPGAASWMQGVAREMNLSETAFLVPGADGWGLRWFTPAVEVDLCGHATLASAHVLWEAERLSPKETARFHTQSGLLTATRRGQAIDLDFPAVMVQEATAPPGLLDALAAAAVWVGRTPLGDWLVEVTDAAAVRGLAPDMARLRDVPARGIIVTARADGEDAAGAEGRCDFVSRFFAPRVGVDEDPVTGSAHCALGPFWAERLGREDLIGYQASERGGIVGVRLAGDRVVLSGRAVTVMRGELAIFNDLLISR